MEDIWACSFLMKQCQVLYEIDSIIHLQLIDEAQLYGQFVQDSVIAHTANNSFDALDEVIGK
jgi:hypothetical protein